MTGTEMNELGERIAEHAAHLDAATHRLLTDLRTFDESGAWYKQGSRSCAAWLSWRVGWDVRTANEHVRVANRLGQLPKIDDALRRGEMSFAKVRAMARVATPQNEEMLVEEARYCTGAQLEKICRGYASVRRHDHETTPKDDEQRRYVTRRDTADGMVSIAAVLHPEEASLVWAALERVAAERCREREAARREAEAAAAGSAEPTKPNNHAEVRQYPSGFDRADALLTIGEQILRGTSPDRAPIDLVLTASVDALTRAIPETDASSAHPDPRASSEIAPTASVDPLTRANLTNASANAPTSVAAPRSTAITESTATISNPPSQGPSIGTYIQSRVTQDSSGWIHPTEMFDAITIDPGEIGVFGDGTCVSRSAALRLACDCGVTAVIESEHGTPITIGRKRRTIPASMKRALLRRDRTCRFPGCSARVFLQGHHMKHWMEGGNTELDNLVSLCSHHHRYVHEYGFRVEITCDGVVRFISPRGMVVQQVPDRPASPNLGWPTILADNEALGITAETCACGWNGGPVNYHLCVDALIAADEGRIRYPI